MRNYRERFILHRQQIASDWEVPVRVLQTQSGVERRKLLTILSVSAIFQTESEIVNTYGTFLLIYHVTPVRARIKP